MAGASDPVAQDGRRSMLKLAAGLSAASMAAAAESAAAPAGGAEGLQLAADSYQNFDRALAAKQRQVAAPLVAAKERGDARTEEQGKRFDATMEKLNNCQVFRPVGDGGGCALTVGQKVFAFSGVPCQNCEAALGPGSYERRVSLSDFTERGKWVVLWFFPEGGLSGGGNEAEAAQFERMLREFAALDAVVVGCSTQPAAEQRRSLVAPRKLTFPLLSDAGRVVAEAYGAADDFGSGTKRQTFIIDPTGRLRWQEVNIDFGIGEFNVENHPRRVLRNLERERGQDGWQV